MINVKNHVKNLKARARISLGERKRTCAKFPLYALSAHDKEVWRFSLLFVVRKAMEIYMKNIVVVIIIAVIIGLAIGYIIREKKKGARCIGCPSGGKCSCGCSDCGNELLK